MRTPGAVLPKPIDRTLMWAKMRLGKCKHARFNRIIMFGRVYVNVA